MATATARVAARHAAPVPTVSARPVALANVSATKQGIDARKVAPRIAARLRSRRPHMKSNHDICNMTMVNTNNIKVVASMHRNDNLLSAVDT